eukprot:jgi/Chlat1/8641/Chrsp87S08032
MRGGRCRPSWPLLLVASLLVCSCTTAGRLVAAQALEPPSPADAPSLPPPDNAPPTIPAESPPPVAPSPSNPNNVAPPPPFPSVSDVPPPPQDAASPPVAPPVPDVPPPPQDAASPPVAPPVPDVPPPPQDAASPPVAPPVPDVPPPPQDAASPPVPPPAPDYPGEPFPPPYAPPFIDPTPGAPAPYPDTPAPTSVPPNAGPPLAPAPSASVPPSPPSVDAPPPPPPPPPTANVTAPAPVARDVVPGTGAEAIRIHGDSISFSINLPVRGICNISSFESNPVVAIESSTATAEADGASSYTLQVTLPSGEDVVGIQVPVGACVTADGTQSIDVGPIVIIRDTQQPVPVISTTALLQLQDTSVGMVIKFNEPLTQDLVIENMNVTGSTISKKLSRVDNVTYALLVELPQGQAQVLYASVPEGVVTDLSGWPNVASNVITIKHEPNITAAAATAGEISSNGVIATAAGAAATSIAVGVAVPAATAAATAGATATATATSGVAASAAGGAAHGTTSTGANALLYLTFHVQTFAAMHDIAAPLPPRFRAFTQNLRWTNFQVGGGLWAIGADTGHFGNNDNTADNNTTTTRRRRSRRLLELTNSTTMLQPADQTLQDIMSTVQASLSPNGEAVDERLYQLFGKAQQQGWKQYAEVATAFVVFIAAVLVLHGAIYFIIKRVFEKNVPFILQFPRIEIFVLTISLLGVSHASSSLVTARTAGNVIVGLCTLIIFPLAFALFSTHWVYKNVLKRPIVRFVVEKKVSEPRGCGLCSKPQGKWETIRANVESSSTASSTSGQVKNSTDQWGLYFEDFRGPETRSSTPALSSGEKELLVTQPEQDHASRCAAMRVFYLVLTIWLRVVIGTVVGGYSRHKLVKNNVEVGLLAAVSVFQALFVVCLRPFVDHVMEVCELVSVLCELGAYVCIFLVAYADSLALDVDRLDRCLVVMAMSGIISQLLNQYWSLYKTGRGAAGLVWHKIKSYLAGQHASKPEVLAEKDDDIPTDNPRDVIHISLSCPSDGIATESASHNK